MEADKVRWISVEEGMPEVMSLQRLRQTQSATESYRGEYQRYIVLPADMIHADATHWMPLPEPPK